MNGNKIKYTFLFLSLAFSFLFFSQNTDYCAQQKKLFGVLKKYHYNPPVFDAKTNTEVLDLFIEKLDPQRIYFYKKDIDNFYRIISDTPDEEAFCTLFQTIWPVYKKRFQQADSLITVIGDNSLDYSAKDTVYFHSKTKREYAAT